MITLPMITVLMLTVFVTVIISIGITLLIVKRRIYENEFLKGKVEGERETLQKFTISYEPFIEVEENFIKKRAEAGYFMQMFYSGMPIGDRARRVTKTEENYKDENAKYLIDAVVKVVHDVALLVDPLGIPVRIDSVPQLVKKKAGSSKKKA